MHLTPFLAWGSTVERLAAQQRATFTVVTNHSPSRRGRQLARKLLIEKNAHANSARRALLLERPRPGHATPMGTSRETLRGVPSLQIVDQVPERHTSALEYRRPAKNLGVAVNDQVQARHPLLVWILAGCRFRLYEIVPCDVWHERNIGAQVGP